MIRLMSPVNVLLHGKAQENDDRSAEPIAETTSRAGTPPSTMAYTPSRGQPNTPDLTPTHLDPYNILYATAENRTLGVSESLCIWFFFVR